MADGLTHIVDAFLASTAEAMILLAEVPEPQRFGVAELLDGRIVSLVEKPLIPKSNLALVGVYLVNIQAIDRIEPSARGELEITDAIQRVIDDGREVAPHLVKGWWKDTGRLEDILEANRMLLDVLAPRIDGEVGEGVRLEGKVVIEKGARLRDCVVRGPAIIGERTIVENAYVGPFTSIYYGCTLRNSEIEHSIVLENSRIENVSTKIEGSLIGMFPRRLPSPDASEGAQADARRSFPRGTGLMPWKPLLQGMESVLERLRDVPASQRMGRIDGVMVKTFLKHADQRGYFIEQLKRGDLDD